MQSKESKIDILLHIDLFYQSFSIVESSVLVYMIALCR